MSARGGSAFGGKLERANETVRNRESGESDGARCGAVEFHESRD